MTNNRQIALKQEPTNTKQSLTLALLKNAGTLTISIKNSVDHRHHHHYHHCH